MGRRDGFCQPLFTEKVSSTNVAEYVSRVHTCSTYLPVCCFRQLSFFLLLKTTTLLPAPHHNAPVYLSDLPATTFHRHKPTNRPTDQPTNRPPPTPNTHTYSEDKQTNKQTNKQSKTNKHSNQNISDFLPSSLPCPSRF